jgi:hypothetical protein
MFLVIINEWDSMRFSPNLVLINLGYHPVPSCLISVISSGMTISLMLETLGFVCLQSKHLSDIFHEFNLCLNFNTSSVKAPPVTVHTFGPRVT